MNIGIIILCRYNSSRLPGKILKTINGKTILDYIIERIETVVSRSHIIVATSTESTDNPIVEYCSNHSIQVFRGSLTNVAERFLHCMKHFEIEYGIRINGDNIFVDTESLKNMIDITKLNNYNVISNLKGRSFPKGMSIEIIKRDFYKKIYAKFSRPEAFEHVTIDIYPHENDTFYFYYNTTCPECAGKQMAIDTVEDFKRAKKIINSWDKHHTLYNLKDIYREYSKLI
ncbi:MAG: hypothetical protein PF481_10870 [Bacteroidales bacterium]|jgi:spore coat polysaccharide biosynthesis protein SpsF|nr:hypothetical protein [Bacteroidales bacterium]